MIWFFVFLLKKWYLFILNVSVILLFVIIWVFEFNLEINFIFWNVLCIIIFEFNSLDIIILDLNCVFGEVWINIGFLWMFLVWIFKIIFLFK